MKPCLYLSSVPEALDTVRSARSTRPFVWAGPRTVRRAFSRQERQRNRPGGPARSGWQPRGGRGIQTTGSFERPFTQAELVVCALAGVDGGDHKRPPRDPKKVFRSARFKNRMDLHSDLVNPSRPGKSVASVTFVSHSSRARLALSDRARTKCVTFDAAS